MQKIAEFNHSIIANVVTKLQWEQFTDEFLSGLFLGLCWVR